MPCPKLNITDFFRFAETKKIIHNEVTDLCFAEQKINAHFEYSPFGKTTVATGTVTNNKGENIVNRFNFRFSSEYFDTESGLVYYNYRYYSPALGRWLSRDPIWEYGGINLYAMVGNDPANWWDWLGLKDKEKKDCYCVLFIAIQYGKRISNNAAHDKDIKKSVKTDYEKAKKTETALYGEIDLISPGWKELDKLLAKKSKECRQKKDNDCCKLKVKFYGHGNASDLLIFPIPKNGIVGVLTGDNEQGYPIEIPSGAFGKSYKTTLRDNHVSCVDYRACYSSGLNENNYTTLQDHANRINIPVTGYDAKYAHPGGLKDKSKIITKFPKPISFSF